LAPRSVIAQGGRSALYEWITPLVLQSSRVDQCLLTERVKLIQKAPKPSAKGPAEKRKARFVIEGHPAGRRKAIIARSAPRPSSFYSEPDLRAQGPCSTVSLQSNLGRKFVEVSSRPVMKACADTEHPATLVGPSCPLCKSRPSAQHASCSSADGPRRPWQTLALLLRTAAAAQCRFDAFSRPVYGRSLSTPKSWRWQAWGAPLPHPHRDSKIGILRSEPVPPDCKVAPGRSQRGAARFTTRLDLGRCPSALHSFG